MKIFKNTYKKINYTFLGWKDEEIKNKFHDSINFWGQEVMTGRHLPRSPKGVMFIDGKENKNGTIIKSTITIDYLPEYVDEKTIDKFIDKSDILVEKIIL